MFQKSEQQLEGDLGDTDMALAEALDRVGRLGAGRVALRICLAGQTVRARPT